MKKNKEFGKKVLEWGYKRLCGSKIGKIPGVPELFLIIASKIFDDIIQVDGQRLRLPIAFGFEGFLELYRTGKIEPHVTQLFCSLIREGMTVVDVGASFGYYTLLAAKRVGNSGLVFAFEPNPQSYEVLIENIKMNNWKNVKTFQLAISDRREEVILNIPKMGQTGSTFARRDNIVRKIRVKALPLDSFLELRKVDIVKIDVEGAELKVLRGMRNILREGRAKIICEIHPKQIASLGGSISEIMDILEKYEYDCYLINEKCEIIETSILSNEHAHYLFQRG